MPLLDLQTILVSYILSNILCAFVVLLLWRQNRQRFAGTGWWLLCFVLQMASILFSLLRGSVSDWFAIVLCNTLLIAGNIALYHGLGRFVGLPLRQRRNVGLLTAFALVHAYFTFVQPNMAARVINLSLGLLALDGQCAWLLLRRVAPAQRAMTNVLGLVFLSYCALHLGRIGANINTPPGQDVFASMNPWDALVALGYTLLFFAQTFGLFLMINRRLFLELTQQHAALRESEANYRTLFENAPVLLWEERFDETLAYFETLRQRGVTDFEDYFTQHPEDVLACLRQIQILQVNHATLSFFGARDLPELQRHLATTFTDDALSVFRAALVSLANRRPVFQTEATQRTLSGDLRYVHIRSFLYGADGGVLVAMTDISARKRTEETLRENEAQLQAIFDFAGVAIALTDTTGKWLRINRTMAEMLGYSIEELLKLSNTDITHPDDITATRQHVQDLVQGKIASYQLEKRYLHKDGHPVWLALSVEPIRGKEHEIVALIGAAFDITDRKQAEAALRDSEARFRALFEQAHSSIVIIDPATGRILDCNRQAHEHLGYTAAEFLQLSVADVDMVTPETMLAGLQAIREQGNLVFETRQRRKTGEIRDMRIHASRITSHDQTFILGIGHDMTEQKQAEEELKLNEARLESLLRISQLQDTALQPILDFALEEAIQLTGSQIGYIYYYDEATRQFTLNSWSKGVMRECTITKPQTVYDLEKTGIWGEAVRQRQPILVNDFHTPHPLKKGYPAGHAPLRRFLTVPVIVDGNIVAVTGVANKADEYNQADVRQLLLLMDSVWNICQRKQAEEELRKFSRAVEQSGSAIVITDSTGAIEYVNPAFCVSTGYTRQEAIGQNPRVLKSGHMSPDVYANLWRTITDGNVWQGELLNRNKNGGLYWESATISPVKDAAGTTTHYLAVKENITERKRLEEELRAAKEAAEAANRAKSVFLANMSHELRTPLNGILGYAQILLRDVDLTDAQREGVNTIRRSGDHLLGLINDILDLAKVEAGKVELALADVHFAELLSGISDIIRVRADAKGIAFRLETAPTLPQTIRADERRLRQVLLNLLGNAVKFTERGTVTLRVGATPCVRPETAPSSGQTQGQTQGSAPTEIVRFEITDTGIGIAPDDLPKLFAAFQQVGDDRYKAQGTGLGLALSRNLIRVMGGDLRVTSALGQESTFWFELTVPVVVAAANDAQPTRPPIIGIVGQPPRILIVDDDATNRQLLLDTLAPLGFDLHTARNGREGWERCQRVQPHAIITDLRMPDLDGISLIRQLRQDSAYQTCVIFASSASVYAEDRQQSLAAGAQAFLPKPLDMERLLHELQQRLHLTWQYATLSEQTEAPTPDAEIICPPQAIVQSLYDSALMGDILELRQQIAALAAQDARFAGFVRQLEPLARGFNMREVQRVLAGYLAQEAAETPE